MYSKLSESKLRWFVATMLALTAGFAGVRLGHEAVDDVDASVDASAIDGGFTSIQVVGAAAPAVSPSDRATIYYDTTSDTLKTSLNGAAYADIAVGGLTGAGANTQVAYFTGTSAVASEAGMTYATGTDTLTLVGRVIASGGDSAGSTNFEVEAGEGLYDCGTDCVAVAAGGQTPLSLTYPSSGTRSFTLAILDTTITVVDNTTATIQLTTDSVSASRFRTNKQYWDGNDIGTVTDGTCTSETEVGTSVDQRGGVTADCAAGETIIVNFGGSWVSSTPFCVVSAGNDAAKAAQLHVTSSLTVLTITSGAGMTAGQVNWFCAG